MRYYKAFWLGVYVAAAVAAACLFAVRGELEGDFKGVVISDLTTLLVATGSIVIAYLVCMGPVYNWMESVRVKPMLQSPLVDESRYCEWLLSILVFLIQLTFLVFCLVEQVGIAGSTRLSYLPLKYVWVLFPADAIFLVYYCLYRRSPWTLPNLGVYMVSNVLRGWLGFWLVILFVEGAYRMLERRFDWKKISALLAVFVILIPYLVEIKWKMRDHGYAFLANVSNLMDMAREVDWWQSMMLTLERSLMRLQHVDNVTVIINNSTFLSEKVLHREFLYFFEEGLPQFALERLIGWPRIPDIHLKLLEYFAVFKPTAPGVVSNTHTGLVGWFWITPGWWLAYVGYVFLLAWLGIWLAKKQENSGLIVEFAWFAGLIWLMNGWFGAYIEFLQAMVVILCLRIFIKRSLPSVGRASHV